MDKSRFPCPLRKNDTLEALLIGILPEYQGKGASVLMFKAIRENCIRRGVTRFTNPVSEAPERPLP